MSELVSIHRGKPGTLRTASIGAVSTFARPTPQQPLIISASELRDFLRCRVRWHWRYQERLEPIGGKEALSMGTLVHDISEAWYRLPLAKRGVKAMTRIAREKVKSTKLEALNTEARELIEAMCIGYAAWAKVEDREIGLESCLPEESFELPVTADGSILMRGRIDNSFKPTTLKRTMAILELKTAGQFRDKGLDTLVQLSVYLWALRQKYPKCDRFIAYYTEMRKQMPSERVRAPLFQRQEVERTAEEIDQWVLDVQHTALDMLNPAIYPNPNANCSWDCDFQIPCSLRGTDDLEHVLSTGYRTKEKRT